MTIRIQSIAYPLDQPQVRNEVVTALRVAGALGLLRRPTPARIDLQSLAVLLKPVLDRDIGTAMIRGITDVSDVEELSRRLQALVRVMRESPVPGTEWSEVLSVLGVPLTARLLSVSEPSVRRYAKDERPTPDQVAARLHYLALLIGDLRGGYNSLGIRSWFSRPRRTLDGKAPVDLFVEDWEPEQSGPRAVRELASRLVDLGAT